MKGWREEGSDGSDDKNRAREPMMRESASEGGLMR